MCPIGVETVDRNFEFLESRNSVSYHVRNTDKYNACTLHYTARNKTCWRIKSLIAAYIKIFYPFLKQCKTGF